MLSRAKAALTAFSKNPPRQNKVTFKYNPNVETCGTWHIYDRNAISVLRAFARTVYWNPNNSTGFQ